MAHKTLKDLPLRLKPAPNILFRQVGNEGVLLDLNQTHYFGLNEVGVRVWQLLAADVETPNVVSQLLAEYEVNETTLQQDIAELLAALLHANLIHAA